MAIKIFAAVVAVALVLAFVGPMVIIMKDAALTGVILIGVVVMVFDIWHSLR